jgi:dTDP-4-dehydrorhamnose 3,5-epimerase-like enzyme
MPNRNTHEITPTEIPEVVIVEPKMIWIRGFSRTFPRREYSALGVGRLIVQDNMSRSSRGAARLAFPEPKRAGKLVGVMRGRY